ncbi:hypothetical protein [Spirosoma oryzicola]|uniref:hypothetical protein n=1 Tax=Spirosoma oryzicola TaxID=2898794 RepID=UPI001E5C1A14|nr:hypothetical protein [Spirosoma oryzicola]UHG93235.1 hypothetical protein LQ777_10120 [Spirosoma oryzicola]
MRLFLFLSFVLPGCLASAQMKQGADGTTRTNNLSDLSSMAQARYNLKLSYSDIRGLFSVTGYGSYDPLTGVFTITTPTWSNLSGKPTKLSEFTNDLNLATLGQINDALAAKQNALTTSTNLSVGSVTALGGLILKSPNGTLYKLIVSDAGTLSTTTL